MAFVIKGLESDADAWLFSNSSAPVNGTNATWAVDNRTIYADILGRDGSGIGFEGLPNSLVVEFDSFFNGDLGEPGLPHVSVHSMGVDNNTADRSSYIASWSLAGPEFPLGYYDGLVHTARVEFLPGLHFQNILRSQTTSPHTLDLSTVEEVYQPVSLVDEPNQGGTYRVLSPDVGTMSVFLDDMTLPLFSFPIDLKRSLRLTDNTTAVVGFTAATGRRWQNTYLLDWSFCEGEGCGQWVANQNTTCDVADVNADFSGNKWRNERKCTFWNSPTMWDKQENRVMRQGWVQRTNPVTSDPSYPDGLPLPDGV
jgi:hypothetical protein